MKKSIHVNMPAFEVEAREDANVVRKIVSCSFGREGHRTPIIAHGRLSLTKRDKDHHSSIYNSASMPYALFFEQDLTCAFHEGSPQVASHGCIHLLPADAKWLFEWAGKDPVDLFMVGPYPIPPIKAGSSPAVA